MLETPGVEHRVVDLRESAPIYQWLVGADALVHFGNLPNVQSAPARQVYRDNIQINLHTLEAAVEVGIRRIVFASSVQVIAGTRKLHDDPMTRSALPELPVTGEAPANPSNLYALSKLAGEDQLRMLVRLHPDLSAVALRLPFTSRGPVVPHRLDLEQVKLRWWDKTHLDECFAWLDVAEVGPLVEAILSKATPGYACLFPASDDSQLGWPADRIAERFFPGTPVRVDLSGRFTVVDNTPITAKYGWKPADLAVHRQPAQARAESAPAVSAAGI